MYAGYLQTCNPVSRLNKLLYLQSRYKIILERKAPDKPVSKQKTTTTTTFRQHPINIYCG